MNGHLKGLLFYGLHAPIRHEASACRQPSPRVGWYEKKDDDFHENRSRGRQVEKQQHNLFALAELSAGVFVVWFKLARGTEVDPRCFELS